MNGKPSSKHGSKAVCVLFVLREPFCKAIMTLEQRILTYSQNGTMIRTPSGYWWKCGAGHSYRAKITDRTIEQKGCPQCEAEFQQALPQMLIMMYGAQNSITVKSNSDSELGVRLVAYLPELHCAVDIAGATVTEKREQSVKAHICQSNRLGYYLIKRTTNTSQMAAEIKTLFIRNHIYLHTDSGKDVQVLRERFLEWKYRNACKLNGKY